MNNEWNNKQPTLASLCTGYGGLDMAVMTVFSGELAWCTDNDKHVAQIIALAIQACRTTVT